ncbi:ArsR family transcriptional regulator [Geotalea sp. SG265]|uniref:rhodanese-like domain-containing protein n=1 Tax=Geotalea sp. SG265 TaxID=2922867 RepID=UPI001FAF997E|nr:ArsR family transcriptional regulator [Geotalea sp. SG265]
MGDIPRTTVSDARQRVEEGRALLACAYESEEVCKGMLIAGAMTLAQFRERVPTLDKGQEVIFYCA